MHELSVSAAVVDTAVRHAGGRPVAVVNLRVGHLRQVVPDSLLFYFGLVARDTVCAGARLEVEVVPARLRCEGCDDGVGGGGRGVPLPVVRRRGRAGADRRGAGGRVDRAGGGGRMHRVKVRVIEDALDANNTIARANRDDFDRHGVTVVNLMSAPGAGKTTLLEQVLGPGIPGVRTAVLEGDVQGSLDADRLADHHIAVVQLNTGNGFGGECHLDANMVRSALPALPLAETDVLIVENVGNLVCPAEFMIGEDARIMVASVAEGEDKPLKYPLMFRACELVIVNKIDLLPHVDFDMDKFLYHLDAVHPGVEHLLVSARTGEGVEEVRDWFARLPARAGAPA